MRAGDQDGHQQHVPDRRDEPIRQRKPQERARQRTAAAVGVRPGPSAMPPEVVHDRERDRRRGRRDVVHAEPRQARERGHLYADAEQSHQIESRETPAAGHRRTALAGNGSSR
jgi:hypothetical protein